MSKPTKALREQLQAEMDILTDPGDVVTFKLHTGDPGPDCDQNLFLGDGMPQQWTQVTGGDIEFRIPDLDDSEVTICAVTMWSGEKGVVMPGLLPRRHNVLRAGDVIRLTKLGPPWFEVLP
ncbi:hypothetical protein NONO_c59660 [Nocardia nova SH22a]|uniref:Uncharacterized protein n=1 Tax=Nocardia nova SH22a TaxID=1415166 RepID=W5TNA4_9NOCA|nr:hypothetical protein [Nocardia nova]AHH20742.1 hypothetical protein NONO_c59660 [Nocardia nova SH22a]